MKVSLRKRINIKIPLYIKLTAFGLSGVSVYILFDDFYALGAHYFSLFIFIMMLSVLIIVISIFNRSKLSLSALAASIITSLALFLFLKNDALRDEALTSIVNLNKPLMEACAIDARKSKNRMSICLEEDEFIEWKRVLICVPQANLFPTGKILNSPKIDVFDGLIKSYKGDANIDEIIKGAAYQVDVLNPHFLLVSYTTYTM